MGKCKGITFFFIVIFGFSPLTAQTLVLDVENIVATIENGYKMVEQFNVMIETLQTSYQTAENSLKAMKELRMDELDLSDPLGSYKSIMTYGDRLMYYRNTITDQITQPNYQYMGVKFSIEDMFSRDPEKAFMNNDLVRQIADEFFWDITHEMTDAQKAQFNAKYGMSPAHYYQWQAIKKTGMEATKDVMGLVKNIIANIGEDTKRLNTIASYDTENSSYGELQKSNIQLTGIASFINELTQLTAFQIEQNVLKEQEARIKAEDEETKNKAMIDSLPPERIKKIMLNDPYEYE